MTKTYTPTFPRWDEVAISLFLKDSVQHENTVPPSLKSFLGLISDVEKNFTIPPSDIELIGLSQKYGLKRNDALEVMSEDKIKEQTSDLPMSGNEFYLVGDTLAMEFLWRSENTKDLMGLASNEDFNYMKICGMDDRDELYHPEDVAHIVRFGTNVLIIVAISGFAISPYTDYYEVNFRTGWSDKRKHKTITRRCYLSNWPERKEGTRHFDSWRVTDGHERFHHLQWLLHCSDGNSLRLLNGMFYILNCVLLGITPHEAILANLIAQQDTKYKDTFNHAVADALGISEFQYENQQTYFNQKSQLKNKIDSLIFNLTRGHNFKIKPTSESFHFRCGQTGILGMNQEVQECIWKNVN